jgi:Protein of unknown function (DUF3892)
MTASYEIKCISKSNRMNLHERITAIGGVNADGSMWKLSQEQAISGIEQGKWNFFVKAQNRAVDVVVAVSRLGNKYLKTVADGEQPNNLLSLYECQY